MVTKWKWSWSLLNLGQKSSEYVVNLQNVSDGFFALITGATYIASDATYALIVTLLAFVANKLIACLEIEKLK
jgi:hypothetical protein